MRSIHHYLCNQALVHQARADALIDRLQTQIVRSDDGGETRIIAIIEQLEELLAGPWRVLLRAQIIEHKQFRLAHTGEKLVVYDSRGGRKCGTQVIEQIRNGREEHQ